MLNVFCGNETQSNQVITEVKINSGHTMEKPNAEHKY